MKSIIKGLKSVRLTVYLLICITVISVLGIIIPQKKLLGRDLYESWKAGKPGLVSFLESLQFTEIYTSPIAYTLLGLFFLNLILVMLDRIPAIWKKTLTTKVGLGINAIQSSKHYMVLKSKGIEEIRNSMQDAGYRFFSEGMSFWAVKNRFSPLATILFHLSFFLLLAGGLTTFYTKFSALVGVAVGETFTGQYGSFVSPKIGDVPKTTFTVKEVIPAYFRQTIPVDIKVTLSTKSGEKIARINEPFKEGSLYFVVKNIDIAPLFIIEDETGREIEGAYIKLGGLKGRPDTFTMFGYGFQAVFFADYSKEMPDTYSEKINLPQSLKQTPMGEQQVRQAREIINPAFFISALKDGLVLNEGIVTIGESIVFNGYRLFFKDIEYWVQFYVVNEYGKNVVYAGFILMILAITARFVFYRRDINGMIEGDNIHIGGRGEFYPALFEDEFNRIVTRVKTQDS